MLVRVSVSESLGRVSPSLHGGVQALRNGEGGGVSEYACECERECESVCKCGVTVGMRV